jgi:diguanylate cyclase (GGDEF)-like protein
MRSLPPRKLVSGIGISLAVATAVLSPLAYFGEGYSQSAGRLDFQAQVNAGSLAKYIYTHDALWQYQPVRISELLDQADVKGEVVRKRVFGADNKLVLEEGAVLPAPTMTRSAPVVVAGSTLGRIEIESSLRDLVQGTALVAFLSIILGLLIYLALRVFPLRVLDRTLAELQEANARLSVGNQELKEREDELSTQNGRFETALANISHGLVMFDASWRLVVCNRRYGEIYRDPPDMLAPGTSLRSILERRIRNSGFPDMQLDRYMEELNTVMRSGKSFSRIFDLPDARTIIMNVQPMTGGGFVATHEDITERQQAEAKMAHMATHDALTDLPNRVRFREMIQLALTGADRDERFALLCLDLDRFKSVNDTLGHPIGDAVLRDVAERLQRCVEPIDTVTRLSGDEFAIVRRASNQPTDATHLAMRLIDTIGEAFDVGGHQVMIGTSLGIAIGPSDGGDPDQLLRNADMALYRAKANGRGTYHFFQPEMDAQMQARRVLELDLRRALAAGEFEVYYQPLVNLDTNKVAGFEALVRWNHPKRGMLLPGEFISVAEEIGLIGQLGEWVLRQACLQAATWPRPLTIAVNLSPVQFRSGNLVLAVVAALGASGLAPRRLELEITESVLLQDTTAILEALHQLRGLGVRISMDDFGTGYSSLSYLRSFPFDKIKIDRSFVAELGKNSDCVAIVRAVTGLGSSLGMATTAEGVETKEQLDMLRAEGCSQVQGFLFSHPRPASEIPFLLHDIDLGAEAA